MIKKTFEINKNIEEGQFKFKEVRKTGLDYEESVVNYKFDKNKWIYKLFISWGIESKLISFFYYNYEWRAVGIKELR